MGFHQIVIPSKLASKDIDAWVRPVYAPQDLDNGAFFSCSACNATSGSMSEVWNITVPTTGSLTSLWMLLEPELPFALSGTSVYNGIGTIRNFYVTGSSMGTAVKLQNGDIITTTADQFAAGAGVASAYANVVTGAFYPTWAANMGAGMGLQYLNTVSIPYADGTIGNSSLTAYRFVVVGN